MMDKTEHRKDFFLIQSMSWAGQDEKRGISTLPNIAENINYIYVVIKDKCQNEAERECAIISAD